MSQEFKQFVKKVEAAGLKVRVQPKCGKIGPWSDSANYPCRLEKGHFIGTKIRTTYKRKGKLVKLKTPQPEHFGHFDGSRTWPIGEINKEYA